MQQKAKIEDIGYKVDAVVLQVWLEKFDLAYDNEIIRISKDTELSLDEKILKAKERAAEIAQEKLDATLSAASEEGLTSKSALLGDVFIDRIDWVDLFEEAKEGSKKTNKKQTIRTPEEFKDWMDSFRDELEGRAEAEGAQSFNDKLDILETIFKRQKIEIDTKGWEDAYDEIIIGTWEKEGSISLTDSIELTDTLSEQTLRIPAGTIGVIKAIHGNNLYVNLTIPPEDDELEHLLPATISQYHVEFTDKAPMVVAALNELDAMDIAKAIHESGGELVYPKSARKVFSAKRVIKAFSKIAVVKHCKVEDKESAEDVWCVYSEKGRLMGRYKTEAEANKRLQQIEYFKRQQKMDRQAGVELWRTPEGKWWLFSPVSMNPVSELIEDKEEAIELAIVMGRLPQDAVEQFIKEAPHGIGYPAEFDFTTGSVKQAHWKELKDWEDIDLRYYDEETKYLTKGMPVYDILIELMEDEAAWDDYREDMQEAGTLVEYNVIEDYFTVESSIWPEPMEERETDLGYDAAITAWNKGV